MVAVLSALTVLRIPNGRVVTVVSALTILYVIVAALLVVADVFLVRELRAVRRELVRSRDDSNAMARMAMLMGLMVAVAQSIAAQLGARYGARERRE
jgi:hypothetical protein